VLRNCDRHLLNALVDSTIQNFKKGEKGEKVKEKTVKGFYLALYPSYSNDPRLSNELCIISSRREAKSKTTLIESVSTQSVRIR
jgi:hypothetical protein